MPSSMELVKAAEAVASVDDLLLEILFRLPVKPLLRFKTVSKHWLSLITNPKFSLNHSINHCPNPALGLFLPCPSSSPEINPEFEYIHFDIHNPITSPPFTKLEFAKDSAGITILQSCNGLLLCSSFRAQEPKCCYYVYNPTTKQFFILPKPDGLCGGTETDHSRMVHGAILAFNPAKSPHYKVIFVRGSNLGPAYYQIEIYSSESGSWRISGDPFSADDLNFQNGVYWNGSVHWISNHIGTNNTSPLYFNPDQEMVKEFPLPEITPNNNYVGGAYKIGFFGESNDHLHLIPTNQFENDFNVYELKRDYSEWFVKYNVDLIALSNTFPRIIRKQIQIVNSRHCGWNIMRANLMAITSICEYLFSVLALARGEKQQEEDDGFFLVLQIPGKIIRYDLVSQKFHELCDFEGDQEEYSLRFNSSTTASALYIESLYWV